MSAKQDGRVDEVSFSTVEKVVKALARIGHTFPESQEEQAARFESLVLDLCRSVQSHFDGLTAKQGGRVDEAVELAVYEAWFRGEQGKPYDGGWVFARAAWLARAALAQNAQGETVDTELLRDLETLASYMGLLHPSIDITKEHEPTRTVATADTIRAAAALLARPHAECARVPDGWVLVPREPTEVMYEAGRTAVMARDCSSAKWSPRQHFNACGASTVGIPDADLAGYHSIIPKGQGAALVYHAMLAAAPSQSDATEAQP